MKEDTYQDIIHKKRPAVPKGHPAMSIENRAKIFSPFAALRGFDKKIREEQEQMELVPRSSLSNEIRDRVSKAIANLKKGDPVQIKYFQVNVMSPGNYGTYETIEGLVGEIDSVYQTIQIDLGRNSFRSDVFQVINFEDIVEITDFI